MRILHVISSSGMYGAESVIVSLSKWLNAERHRSSVAVFYDDSRPVPELYGHCRKHHIDSHLIAIQRRIDYGAVRAIRELALSTGAEIVHAHGYKADVFVHLALCGTAIPYVATCHNWTDETWKMRFYGSLDRLALRQYPRVAAVSEHIEERLKRAGIDSDRIELIHNGVDVGRFRMKRWDLGVVRNPGVVVGFVGRLAWEKGPDIFVKAAAEILKNQRSLKFLLVGDGPERSALERMSRAFNIEERMWFLGRVEDMPSLYRELDVMVSPSRREGLPMAILEAMACGVPVVASSVGDVPKLIDPGQTGLLTEPEDPEALANAILSLVKDPYLRCELGAAGSRFINEAYSCDRMAKRYLKFYENAMLKKP